jgi:transcriptional regulator with XRE-family HTH domain
MPRTTTSDVTSVAVGRALRHARQEVGVTQHALATRLNVSAPYVSSIENGRTNVTVGQLSSIADALGVILNIEFRISERTLEPMIPEPPVQVLIS